MSTRAKRDRRLWTAILDVVDDEVSPEELDRAVPVPIDPARLGAAVSALRRGRRRRQWAAAATVTLALAIGAAAPVWMWSGEKDTDLNMLQATQVLAAPQTYNDDNLGTAAFRILALHVRTLNRMDALGEDSTALKAAVRAALADPSIYAGPPQSDPEILERALNPERTEPLTRAEVESAAAWLAYGAAALQGFAGFASLDLALVESGVAANVAAFRDQLERRVNR